MRSGLRIKPRNEVCCVVWPKKFTEVTEFQCQSAAIGTVGTGQGLTRLTEKGIVAQACAGGDT